MDFTSLVKEVDIPKLIKALRYCMSTPKGVINCKGCPYFGSGIDCQNKLHADAAAVIEELDAEETRLLLITSELQDKVVELEEELNDVDIAADDNARQVEELQAEIRESKQTCAECCDEQEQKVKELQARLGEAENSAERWKDMYLTKHEPKRGEWINHKDEHQCSVCRETVVVDEIRWEQIGAYDYCPNCGSKMEVQDG